MAECCPFPYVKGSLIAFNVIFWFSGPAVLGLSIWFYLTVNMYSPVLDMTSYNTQSYVMIAAGGACIVCGICGCLGGVNENKLLVCFFSFSLVVIFGCQLYTCVASFYIYDKVDIDVSNDLNYSIYHLYHYKDDTTAAIDRIQRELYCCGYRDYMDWRSTLYYRDVTLSDGRGREVLPTSCCHDPADVSCNVPKGIPPDLSRVYTKGCNVVLKDWLKSKLLIFGWGAFVFSSFQLLGIVLSCCMYKALSDLYQ
ncbi:CD151 antigen-like [Mizuhopecten yessoensis]|uniref:Tetraspanin n=1 Tax=Mizuhopecten yessoensis TaxID=6573 RepID=A0A210QZI8_MIZYE|nr:CD151 antigen-like [Mizuhopecten yessoensis]XP_021345747.1 CD151 antigen-like [Mizuhopecten yessoensis]OWF54164.1 Tetraspanin-11 [Mizuhopecten yessoensis]